MFRVFHVLRSAHELLWYLAAAVELAGCLLPWFGPNAGTD
jgi:hypothetical protein